MKRRARPAPSGPRSAGDRISHQPGRRGAPRVGCPSGTAGVEGPPSGAGCPRWPRAPRGGPEGRPGSREGEARQLARGQLASVEIVAGVADSPVDGRRIRQLAKPEGRGQGVAAAVTAEFGMAVQK
jgi:hypothetical protein